ncbi:hypothetical protein BZA77DRAFT_116335 [Pyronema omphalodes]|nr:hypothetical protein BZA77DRAFT_116335 [Pyronema omphalodes]
MLGTGCWALDVGHWMLGTGCWALDVGHWMLGTGCWALDVGHWMLGTGCWALEDTGNCTGLAFIFFIVVIERNPSKECLLPNSAQFIPHTPGLAFDLSGNADSFIPPKPDVYVHLTRQCEEFPFEDVVVPVFVDIDGWGKSTTFGVGGRGSASKEGTWV